MIACVCIVAKENNPLLLRVFTGAGEDETKFHHICYCSIDAFEEKEQAMRCAVLRGASACSRHCTERSRSCSRHAATALILCLALTTRATRRDYAGPRLEGRGRWTRSSGCWC